MVVAEVKIAVVPVRAPIKAEVNVAPVADRLVVDAFRIVAVPVVFVLVNEAPVADRLVVEAFTDV